MLPYFTRILIIWLLAPYWATGQGQANTVLGLMSPAANDPWLLWQQPDQLGRQSGLSAAAGSWYRWNTPGAGERMLAISAAVPGGGLAFGLEQQSFAGLRESRHLLGFGRDFSGWQLGIQLQHERQRIAERSRDRLGYGISGAYPLHKQWQLLVAYHQSPLGDENWQRSPLLPKWQAGFAHQLLPQLQLCFGTQLSPGDKPSINSGVFYQPLPHFSLLAGYQSASSHLAFGINYQLSQLKTSLTAQIHPLLGTAYWLDLCFDLPSFSF
jgi:hypothetical protein